MGFQLLVPQLVQDFFQVLPHFYHPTRRSSDGRCRRRCCGTRSAGHWCYGFFAKKPLGVGGCGFLPGCLIARIPEFLATKREVCQTDAIFLFFLRGGYIISEETQHDPTKGEMVFFSHPLFRMTRDSKWCLPSFLEIPMLVIVSLIFRCIHGVLCSKSSI